MGSSNWYDRVQGETLVTADRHYDRWSKEELELVLAFTDDETDAAIATTLGRTLHAVQDIQWRIRTGDITASSVAAMGRPAIQREVCSGCFTEMTPAGTCLC